MRHAVCKRFAISLAALPLLVMSSEALSAMTKAYLTDGYSGCSWQVNGDGTHTIQVTMHFREISSALYQGFVSRGVLIYRYTKSGFLGSPVPVRSIAINKVYSWNSSNDLYYSYIMYTGFSSNPNIPTLREWGKSDKFAAVVQLVVDDDRVKDWPALSIRAGRLMKDGWDDSMDAAGGAYVSRGGADGACTVIDPVTPPPLPITITASAPDWDLGELTTGEGSKTFSNITDALCFSYIPTEVSGKKFFMWADSANGIVGNRFRLRNIDDASQYVPYDLELNNGSTTVRLPKFGASDFVFNESGRTCFTPTFRTTVEQQLKAGTYTDVLTFIVVTKS